MSKLLETLPGVRVVYGSFHQSDKTIFKHQYAGVQCAAMAMAAIIKSNILSPAEWTTDTINNYLIEGDFLYRSVHRLLIEKDAAFPQHGLLRVNDFNVIKNTMYMFNHVFSMDFNDDPEIFGSLRNKRNSSPGVSLEEGLQTLFKSHSSGILIANLFCFAVFKSGDKFYFANSHPTVLKCAYFIECESIHDLHQICKQATGSRDNQYTLHYVDVTVKNDVNQRSGGVS